MCNEKERKNSHQKNKKGDVWEACLVSKTPEDLLSFSVPRSEESTE